MDYKVYLISNKPHLYEEVTASLSPGTVEFFDGTNAGSFSRLVNMCVNSCPTEIIIMMSDKMRPVPDNIEKTLDLINQGYAFVGMYRFGFFGFKKELFRCIGMMDERYVGGGYEDDDIYIRLKEANLSLYLSHEVNYIAGSSSWIIEECRQHFTNKWRNVIDEFNKTTGTTKRCLSELTYEEYDLGPATNTEFLSWEHTQIHAKKCKKYLFLEIEKD